MKTLILLRHAKSGWDEPVSRDFDRPINARGRRGSEAMGRWMRSSGIGFDLIVSSPAIRCVETIEHLAIGYGETMAPLWDKRVYLASAAGLLEVVQDLPDTVDRVILVGHNPGFEDFVLMLVPEADASAGRDAIEEKFPTAALAEISFDVARWDDVAPATGRLATFMRPRDLDPSLGPGSE